ncbi:hypothetical protein [Nostoc sp. ChiSLP03a]|uniref:hypothetical protein n=1 Tax=Nostoc sp. ChiSLP03a TaxID=3075380 RepID=UPI002AD55BE8|nr:hypothetical protein [Nostoc sp. ChiSLP03a]MDZ8215963.1 hypothetical protein [Nostoc sp. ChiSLP03a]
MSRRWIVAIALVTQFIESLNLREPDSILHSTRLAIVFYQQLYMGDVYDKLCLRNTIQTVATIARDWGLGTG